MARPPVCKLMDFGKFKYESALKAREARRNQQQTVIKEMKLRPKIDPHDYETKKGHVVRFLEGGRQGQGHDHVPRSRADPPGAGLTGCCRGSLEEVTELGFVESAPKQDGRNMIMVLAPHRDREGRPRPRPPTAWPADAGPERRQSRPRGQRRPGTPQAAGGATSSRCGPDPPGYPGARNRGADVAACRR